MMFFRQRDYFAIAFCLGWLSTNLVGVGFYMADANAMQFAAGHGRKRRGHGRP